MQLGTYLLELRSESTFSDPAIEDKPLVESTFGALPTFLTLLSLRPPPLPPSTTAVVLPRGDLCSGSGFGDHYKAWRAVYSRRANVVLPHDKSEPCVGSSLPTLYAGTS